MQTTEKFDLWCIVELFGHTKIAGKCTEQNIAGTNMLRVDVPETERQPAFTRFFGSSAIYAINPVDETSAKFFAQQLEVKPIQTYDVKEMLVKNNHLLQSKVESAPSPSPRNDFEADMIDDDGTYY